MLQGAIACDRFTAVIRTIARIPLSRPAARSGVIPAFARMTVGYLMPSCSRPTVLHTDVLNRLSRGARRGDAAIQAPRMTP